MAGLAAVAVTATLSVGSAVASGHVYTVGDNEWTDCHRTNNGAYNPLERLAKIRSMFFSRPGYTLGMHTATVTSRAPQAYPEDVRYSRGDVAFAALHIVGSNNSLAAWTGNTGPTVPDAPFADYFAFQPIVRAIAQESASFQGPVYLFNGDSHHYNSDKPLAEGSKWLSFYGVDKPAPNLSRVTIDGSTGVNNYLRFTIDPRNRDVLSLTRVPFTS